ncbi:MAG TPA: DNA-directed RNA polymerase subunit beta [Dehalococcoidia bacterium]|nr:DNA-directed RNA polymerase subunit beta [Dehalococcoidia bacterium]
MVIADRRLAPSENPDFQGFNSIANNVDVPSLVQVQVNSFEWLKTDGIKDLLEEFSPIEDFSGGRFDLRFLGHEVRKPKHTERECRKREITYSAPLYITVQLVIKETGEVKEQTLFFGDVPMMTENGTFVINGAERVVVSQLVRSPGAYFTTKTDPVTGRELCSAKLIPYRGAWVELETSNKDLLSVKVDRKRKAPISTLLRALGFTTDDDILGLVADVDDDPVHNYMQATLAKDTAATTEEEALLEFYRRLRPGEPPSVDNARELIQNLFFNDRKYDLGRVGRYKLNRRLGVDEKTRTLTKNDFVEMIRRMITINNGRASNDDIDHLGNRRVRAVGELIQNQLRVGLLRMERVVKERMTTQMDPTTTTPAALINIRPVVAAVREFFGGSQLSQFMDQTNPLAELTHKRRLSALGPGGLSRERAGFDVRDVHASHYGRICPIETPEGPNIGLLGSLSTYARLNDYGFIETPYRRILRTMNSDNPDIQGRTPLEDIADKSGKVVAESGKPITIPVAELVNALKSREVIVQAYVTTEEGDRDYLSADDEELNTIGQATTPMDAKGQITTELVEVRVGGSESYTYVHPDEVNYMDVSPMQIVSISTALIPFLEHDDANRALMGSNMQRQAVPLIRPQAPLVGTGMEYRVATDSGQVVMSNTQGVVSESTSDHINVLSEDGETTEYPLTKFVRSNQGTSINQHPIVHKGDKVNSGTPLADSSSTENGELALGQNLLVGFMTFDGYNYEDAIILNEDLVKDDRFTSIHIDKHEVEARETKLGPEEITRDIPNVGEESLRDLDDEGIIRIGAWVTPGDILVGKITPKGETELTAEEKLLRAIFGEKARDVKDTSLRVPHGQHGKVIDVRILTKEKGDDMLPGVTKTVRVWVAHTRKINQGDKMAGRHGNKGVVAKVLPREDMPFLPDGTPLDIMLNPIGVPSRMNLGQLLETHLGWAADTLGFHARTPVFDSAHDSVIEDQLARAWFVRESNAKEHRDLDSNDIDWPKVDAYLEERGFDRDRLWSDAQSNRGVAREACLRIWLKETAGIETEGMKPSELMQESLKISRERNLSAPIFGKQMIFDGRTGIEYDAPITVGNVYMLKLIHLVQDKIHARSTGPYSLITQQPLGGKAQFGGQRFGEMEVWALEAYSAAYTLQEMLTIKSDDVIGRVKTYEAIVKGEEVIQPGVPESFHVLLKELQGLGLSVELLNEDIERFNQAQTQAQEMSATLGTPLGWDDLSDEPLDALDIEELPSGELPVDSVETDESSDDEESDDKSSDDGESEEPTEDSLQTLASEESEEVVDGVVGVEDEEN